MWFIYSATAAAIWGIVYVLFEQIIRRVSVASYLGIALLGEALLLLAYAHSQGNLAKDIATFADSRRLTVFLLTIIVVATIGNALIVSAVAMKNASFVSAIEITYPMFVVLFAWLLFRQPVSLSMAIGGLLILAGSITISLSH
jgi:drug/metabolite transporter (DMT)-like permease